MVRQTHSVFGRIITSYEVEAAVVSTLELWFYTYLREMEVQLDLSTNSLPYPKRFTQRNRFDATLGEEWPRVVTIIGAMMGQPAKDGGDGITATWRVAVGVAIQDSDELEARKLASVYAAIVRKIILDKAKLGGIANATTLLDERPAQLEDVPDQILEYAANVVEFSVQVPYIMAAGRSPDEPDVPPDHPGEYPIVDEVIINVNDQVIDITS